MTKLVFVGIPISLPMVKDLLHRDRMVDFGSAQDIGGTRKGVA